MARRRLLTRIQRSYPLQWITFVAAGREFRIAKVGDPNQVFHDAMRAETQQAGPLAWEPYWAEAWDSAVALAQFTAEQLTARAATGDSAERWLDLGCGVGVVGAVAAACGADTVLGDIAQPGLLFAQLNTWNDRPRAWVRRIDWSLDRLPQVFDCIACADCVYDRRHWPDLDRFWRRHLAPNGSVLISEPNRITGREFRSTIVEQGWWLDPSPGIRTVNGREIILSRLRPTR